MTGPGFYGHLAGAGEVYVHSERLDFERLLATMRENLRRAAATSAAETLAAQDAAAERLATRLLELLPDDDPAVVSRVFLLCLSSAGGLLCIGATPAQFLNIASLAAAKIGGHLPRTELS